MITGYKGPNINFKRSYKENKNPDGSKDYGSD